MTDDQPKMKFFTDQNVPESVALFLEAQGYEVDRLREKIATNSPDTLVAAISEAYKAVLITFDSDFKTLAKREGIGRRQFRTLSTIRFERCRESQAADRIRTAMTLIEHEWNAGVGNRDRRMFIVITSDSIRTHR